MGFDLTSVTHQPLGKLTSVNVLFISRMGPLFKALSRVCLGRLSEVESIKQNA